MNQKQWNQYLYSTHNPPSLTGTRLNEGDKIRQAEIKFVIDNYLPDWNKAGKVLALGCGDGFEIGVFKDKGFNDVIGLTNHKDELLRQDIIEGDMHDIPVEDKTFNYAYSKETLEHSICPYIALCEINRVLKVGGEFMMLISTGMEKQRDTYHFSCFNDWIWYDLFRKAELKVTKIIENDIQTGFIGVKLEDKDFEKLPVTRTSGRYSYTLREDLNGVPRSNLLFK